MKLALVAVLAVGIVLGLGGMSLAADDAAKPITGTAGCAKCAFKGEACAPAVKVGETVYSMKASEKASDETKKMIKEFAGCGTTTPVTIKGEIKEKTIIVDEIAKVEKKKDAEKKA
jgi:hypothetical protein